MSIRPGTLLTERKEMLRRNPKIDVAVVAAHERLERNLKKIGVEIKPSYDIEPPFGRRPAAADNHGRAMIRNL